MCGIVGILGQPADNAVAAPALRRMADALAHRGPDGSGEWRDPDAGMGLGHRRLAIIDLSEAGSQPMVSASGRFVLAFNGEIYNHLELRDELQSAGSAPAWRGHSDTETLLAAIERWGFEDTLKRTVGMFAIALWDREQKELHLARDRFGEKPLYYGWAGGAFLFASELKALRSYPGFDNPVCRDALRQYFRYLYVPAPLTIHERVYKLEPGCRLSIRGAAPRNAPDHALRAGDEHGSLRVTRWWSLGGALADHSTFTDEGAALDELDSRLRRSIELQSISDVPLGAFLSGGVDSSAIVALMQQQSSRPVKTFTVGFEEGAFDESAHARAVAEHLKTEHHELIVTSAQARAVIPALPAMYDEPFADSSQIPTHLVCKAAREHVTVALSGDAGDEVFGGYNRYQWGPRIWNRVHWMPGRLRRTLGAGMRSVPSGFYDVLGSTPTRKHGALAVNNLGQKVGKVAEAMRHSASLDTFYQSLVSAWMHPEDLVIGSGAAAPAADLPHLRTGGVAEQMMWQDTHTYLPDDILCKVDRAAMATSLETRVPFLDHRVVETVWRMPPAMRVRNGQGKWALRELLYRHVPRELIERPKTGFGIPLGEWLRGPLRPWAEELLAPNRIKREGYLHAEPIARAWREHVTGKCDHSSRIWGVLMFQAWLEGSH